MEKYINWLAEKLANDATQLYINRYDEMAMDGDTAENLAKVFLEKLNEINGNN